MERVVTVSILAIFLPVFVRSAVDLTTQPPSCPGENVTFTCNVSSNSIRWEVQGISRTLSPADLGDPIDDGPFVFNLTSFVSSPQAQSVSTATVTVTAMLNGTEIQCTDASVLNGESDNTAILVIGPPSSPQGLRPVSYTCDSAVIEWDPPQDDGGGTIEYTCTISGPENSTVPNCNSPFTLNITANTDYTVSVTATNCAGYNTSSVPIRINATETGPPEDLTIQLDCSMNLELTVTWMNPNVSMLPSTSFPLVCPIEDIVCRINGNEIAGCNAASESFTHTATEGMNDIEVVVSSVVGDSNSSTASIDVFALRVSSGDGCVTTVTVTLNDECQGELTEFGGTLTYAGGSDLISFTSGYTQEVNLSSAIAGTEYDYTVTITQNGAMVGSKTGSLIYGVEASVDPPLPTCVRDDSGCLATCTCPQSNDVTIVFNEMWSTPQCESGPGGSSSSDDTTTIIIIIIVVVIVAIILLVGIIILAIVLYKKCKSSDHDKKKPDEIDLHERQRTSPEPVDNLPTYADPQEIKREEFPGTEDMYTMPDKTKKTPKPEDHLPTYADPSAIEHKTAPATGDLYTVVDKPKRSSKKQPPPPPEGPLQTYAEVDVTKKQRGRELNYSDIQVTGTGDMPTRQPGVIYSDVAPHQHH